MAASWSSLRSGRHPGESLRAQLRRALEFAAGVCPLSRFTVADESMLPSFTPGDRIVVLRFAQMRRQPRPGEVIVLRDPRESGRRLLKRVAAVSPDGQIEVRGDNAVASTDSRSFGPVTADRIVGKVWFKY